MTQAQDTAREIDQNGYITVRDNPISRVGVFPYSGRGLPGADPDKIYMVLRPAEELSHPDTLKSFEMLPIIDEHVMLGEGYTTAAEQKGVHGTTGESAIFRDGKIFTNLRIFSDTLKGLISQGKKQLSAGYRCAYEKSSGFFEGVAYDYIQRSIRGNHLALVREGRMGPEIAVLDGVAFDHFDIELPGETMTDKTTASAQDNKEPTLAQAMDAIEALAKQVTTLTERVSSLALDKEDDEKKAEDEDDKDKEKEEGKDTDEDKEKDKESMDALDARIKALESRPAAAMDTKAILADITRRDALVKEVAPLIGTFDHATMDSAAVTAYAIGKLGIKVAAGQEEAALAGYLAGRKSSPAAAMFAQDTAAPKDGGLLDKRLKS